MQELAEIPDKGFDDQVPSIDGDAVVVVGAVGVVGVVGVVAVVVVDDDVELGEKMLDDSRSKPVHAPVTTAPRMRADESRRFMAVVLAPTSFRTWTV